jgi:hypothetical protein
MQDQLVEVVTRIREHQVTNGRCFRFGIAASAARVAVVFDGDCIRWQFDFRGLLGQGSRGHGGNGFGLLKAFLRPFAGGVSDDADELFGLGREMVVPDQMEVSVEGSAHSCAELNFRIIQLQHTLPVADAFTQAVEALRSQAGADRACVRLQCGCGAAVTRRAGMNERAFAQAQRMA